MFKPLKTRVLLLILAMLALFPGASQAAWYLAGLSVPQDNRYAGKNESASPPVIHSSHVSDFFGARWSSASSHRGSLAATRGMYKTYPSRQKAYASFRLDDVVFTCDDGRTSVTYRTRLNITAQKTESTTTPGKGSLYVGDPDCPWGSCGGHWASTSSAASWTSTAGGTGPLAGIPAGMGFGPTIVVGPNRTATTGIPRVFSASVGTEMGYPNGPAIGTTQFHATATFPTDGPAFELPAGCTCNSVEGNIVDNLWMGVDLPPATVVVAGIVSSDCNGVLAGVTVYLTDGDGVTVSTTTAADGSYLFEGVTSSATETGLIEVVAPAGYDPIDAASIPLSMNVSFDAGLMCADVTVSGSVNSDCDGALEGVEVTFVDGDGESHVTTTVADGSYSFAGIGYSANPGAVSFALPTGYTAPNGTSSAVDLTTSATQDFALECVFVGVSGVVSSDCDGALEAAEVTLVDGNGVSQTTTTDANGAYAFSGIRYSANPGSVTLTVPAGYVAPSGNSAAVDLSAGGVQDFAVECKLVDLTGTISSSCGGELQGVTVDLLDADGEFHTTTTDAEGAYTFADLGFSQEVDAAEVSISIPLGYEAIAPGVAGAALTLDQDRVQDFSLACLSPTGSPRSMGYWKHQANVYLSNKGSAQESSANMATNFPLALFSHFHENDLNGIQVLGVTYIDTGSGHAPIDLQTIQNTLTVNKGGTMADRARQQYLAFLLNVASGKLLTSAIVSADGATASQALQQVAIDILDGNPSNDESAKNIGDIINNAGIVPAGMINLNIDSIAYKNQPLPERFELWQNHPNPFNPRTTIELALAKASNWRVAIFDVAGRLVRQYDGNAAAGVVRVDWDGTDLRGHAVGSGQYFYRAQAAGFDATRKMTLVQ